MKPAPWICLLLVTLLPGFATAAESKARPALFLTPADVSRAREAIRTNPQFAKLAEELKSSAVKKALGDLPKLETAWWDAARQKPWAQTYPEIFHHTWMVPAQWADLARNCARAHLLFPNDGLGAKGRSILLALSDYSFAFEHYDVGMNYTVWLLSALEAYDILHNEFSAAERERLDQFFARGLAAVQQNDAYWVKHEPGGKLNNHYAWHKLCFVMNGLFYGRTNLVEEALHGPKGIDFMLQHGFKDDGLWLEGSIPYQFAATAPLLQIAELLDNAHYPVSLYRSSTSGGRNLRQSYDALIPLLFPDRRLPAIGDCYARRPHLGEYADWEIFFRRFHNPTYAWLISDGGVRKPQALFQGDPSLSPSDGERARVKGAFPRSVSPPQFSKLWPEMGYVALRSVEGTNYWNGDGWSAFVTYASRPVHANADKLSLMLFGNGHLWLPDREAKPSAEHAFSAKIQSELNRATLCHNTVVVDKNSQSFPGRPLQLLECHFLPEAKQVTIGDLTGQLYPGVRQLRTVIVRPDYVLDFFQVSAEKEREFTWTLHVDGVPGDSSMTNRSAYKLPLASPWKYLRNARSAAPGERFYEVFQYAGQTLRCDLTCSAPAEPVICEFPLDDKPEGQTAPMCMWTLRQKSAWFLALYRLNREHHLPIHPEVQPGDLGTWQITFNFEGRKHTQTVPDLAAQSSR